jgi:hypothetical protein
MGKYSKELFTFDVYWASEQRYFKYFPKYVVGFNGDTGVE